MAVRSPQQDDGPVFLLLLLLLLVFVISVVGNTCGCYGTNQVYVHYKPPASGWFIRSASRKFLYQRTYKTQTSQSPNHHFQLIYITRTRRWLLLEKFLAKTVKKRRKLLSNNTDVTNQFVVSCPSQCSCQQLKVNGSMSCLTINGIYEKYSSNITIPQKVTRKKPHDNTARRSPCILAHLAKCIDNTITNAHAEDRCENYTNPLTDINKSFLEDEHYVHTESYYNLTKDPDHNFWLIESESSAFAVSRNTGPCPDQLTPYSTSWLRTDRRFSENITVTCTQWDSLSGD